MNIYIPFTYIIGWSEHKKFYYGAKYAQGCQPSDLWTTYFTSSEVVNDFRKTFGEPDIIKIHRTFSDKDSCVLFENDYLERIDARNHLLFLNQSNGGGKGFYKKMVTEKEKEKTRQTHLKKYGVESSNQSEMVKENKRISMLERHGVEYNFQMESVKEKTKQTCLSIHCVESYNQVPEIKAKKKETVLKNWGYENINQVPEIQEKKKKNCLEKHGVEHTLQVPEFREKGKQTCLEKYGVESSNQSEIVKQSKKESMLENWGYENPSQVPEIKEKKKQKFLEKYGVENYNQLEKICVFCGEMKNVVHESKCKKNPNRKVPNKKGIDCHTTKFYLITSPTNEEYKICSRKNLLSFAEKHQLAKYSFLANRISGWFIKEITRKEYDDC